MLTTPYKYREIIVNHQCGPVVPMLVFIQLPALVAVCRYGSSDVPLRRRSSDHSKLSSPAYHTAEQDGTSSAYSVNSNPETESPGSSSTATGASQHRASQNGKRGSWLNNLSGATVVATGYLEKVAANITGKRCTDSTCCAHSICLKDVYQ